MKITCNFSHVNHGRQSSSFPFSIHQNKSVEVLRILILVRMILYPKVWSETSGNLFINVFFLFFRSHFQFDSIHCVRKSINRRRNRRRKAKEENFSVFSFLSDSTRSYGIFEGLRCFFSEKILLWRIFFFLTLARAFASHKITWIVSKVEIACFQFDCLWFFGFNKKSSLIPMDGS